MLPFSSSLSVTLRSISIRLSSSESSSNVPIHPSTTYVTPDNLMDRVDFRANDLDSTLEYNYNNRRDSHLVMDMSLPLSPGEIPFPAKDIPTPETLRQATEEHMSTQKKLEKQFLDDMVKRAKKPAPSKQVVRNGDRIAFTKKGGKKSSKPDLPMVFYYLEKPIEAPKYLTEALSIVEKEEPELELTLDLEQVDALNRLVIAHRATQPNQIAYLLRMQQKARSGLKNDLLGQLDTTKRRWVQDHKIFGQLDEISSSLDSQSESLIQAQAKVFSDSVPREGFRVNINKLPGRGERLTKKILSATTPKTWGPQLPETSFGSDPADLNKYFWGTPKAFPNFNQYKARQDMKKHVLESKEAIEEDIYRAKLNLTNRKFHHAMKMQQEPSMDDVKPIKKHGYDNLRSLYDFDRVTDKDGLPRYLPNVASRIGKTLGSNSLQKIVSDAASLLQNSSTLSGQQKLDALVSFGSDVRNINLGITSSIDPWSLDANPWGISYNRWISNMRKRDLFADDSAGAGSNSGGNQQQLQTSITESILVDWKENKDDLGFLKNKLLPSHLKFIQSSSAQKKSKKSKQ